MSTNREPNALIHEQSPYLLQHAYNPVQWRAWSEDSFRLAAQQDKPVFVSIGYSTCHWCHVMERESFEDEEVAAILNEHFIAIKVDREERPDIDAVYMTVCQAMSGSGGWPLSAFLTPEKEAFFAGTYFPKRSRSGRIGFVELTTRIAALWKEDRTQLVESAQEVMQELRNRASADFSAELHEDILHKAYLHFSRTFDDQYGGFNAQPKFPSPHNLLFLVRYYKQYEQPQALAMVEKTLEAMRLGGIFDHIGGGFHRYSTDRFWLLPHFEKMLYDNALLLMAYSEAYALTRKELYKQTAQEIITYLQSRMMSPDGAFYSAEDADSEGEEGKFYLWSLAELREFLSEDDVQLMMQVFHCREEGNFFDESSGQQNGMNIPYVRVWHDEVAQEIGFDKEGWKDRWESIRQKLYQHREQRIHPLLDDKILADWNGLMIAAFAIAARFLQEPELIATAEKAWVFIQTRMQQRDGRLWHRYRNGDVGIPAFADDYIYCTWALFELYQSSGKSRYLSEAMTLLDIAFADFITARGALSLAPTNSNDTQLPQHVDAYDGAIPSANSVAASIAQRISYVVDNASYRDKAEAIIKAFGKQLSIHPAGFCMMNMAYMDMLHGVEEVVIAGDSSDTESQKILQIVQRQYKANRIIICNDSADSLLAQRLSIYPAREGMAVYICSSGVCHTSLHNMLEVEKYFAS